ncbi:MAG: 16S rRNA (uracil(1498)-N(3))-methyltransferase [Planctomycetaceae bacterium]|jgi:16S rRNA (uracil1498-N3)-methyltransferase|nr:16S rRNA (uracil(1498)-N(3))-methyltransferase [Planctomycetaceae bacterium]
MSERFYIDPNISTLTGGTAILGGDEAHHFRNVMRGKTGDEIVLFDGTGFSYNGVVEAVQKNTIAVQITERIADTIESPLRLSVATALPKGDRQRFLAEKLAELGVARLVPLALERSVVKATDNGIAKLKRYVIEAAKQCGRNVLMDITEELTLEQYNTLLEQDGNLTKLILHPVSLGQAGQITANQLLSKPLPQKIAVLVGPEGSFTGKEVETALQLGFQPLDLGARVLRTETACVAAASLLLTFAG